MPLFGRKKSASDYVKRLYEAVVSLPNAQDEQLKSVHAEIDKCTTNLRTMLYSTDGTPSTVDDEVVDEFLKCNLVHDSLLPLELFGFEAKKDLMAILTHLLGHPAFVRHLLARPDIFSILMNHYEKSGIALLCGAFIREAIEQSPQLCRLLLSIDVVQRLFTFVNFDSFDIASDAFATLYSLLNAHKELTTAFLNSCYDPFFDGFENLIQSENYVIRRSSLRLLAELLLERSSFEIMSKYISQLNNLKSIMKLLLNRSRNIQFEAFHVFKIFVANPNKPEPIANVLSRNSSRLVKFLGNFHCEGDEQLEEEVQLLITEIKGLGNLEEEQSESD
ncbi:hypothetical protein RCL1_006812 [Eukaryota sp. TZLM3-RCL]